MNLSDVRGIARRLWDRRRHRFVAGTTKLHLAGAVQRVTAFATHVLLARFLGPGRYGGYVLVVSLADLLPRLLELGIRRTVLAKYSRLGADTDTAERARIVAFALLAATASALLVIVIGWPLLPFLGERFLHNRTLGEFAWILSWSGLALVPFSVLTATLESRGHMGAVARIESSAEILRLAAIFTVVYLRLGFKNLFLALLAVSVIQGVAAIIVYLEIRRRTADRHLPALARVRSELGTGLLAEHLRFSVLISLPKRLDQLGGILVLLVLNWVTSPAEVGAFKVAMAFGTLPLWLAAAAGRNLLPVLADFRVAGDAAGFRRAFGVVSLLSGLAMVPIALLLGLIAQWAVPTLYGAEYISSLPLVPFFLVFTVIAAFNIGHGAAYLVDSRVTAINVRTALQFLVAIGVGVPLIYSQGEIGASISYVIGAMFALAFDYLLIWRASRPSQGTA